MDVFVVTDAAIFGRGLFGVFSTLEKALVYKEELERQNAYSCEIKRHAVMGSRIAGGQVFAAHVYDELYDMHTLDGLYSDLDYAIEAVGVKGLILQFVIDMPEKTLMPGSG